MKKTLIFQCFWVILVLVCTILWRPIAAAQEFLVVGVVIRGREVATIEVGQHEENFFIPLESFARLTGSRLETDQDTTLFITPIGVVEFKPDDIRFIDGIAYINQHVIKEKLRISIEFNSEEFALLVDLPWFPGIRKGKTEEVQVEPDVRPPRFSLSEIREEVIYTEHNDDDGFYTSSTTFGGEIYGGSWRVSLENDFRGSKELREYEYFRIQKNTLFQVGLQDISLHPLFNGFTLTGGQVGWTNRPLDRCVFASNATELLSRRSMSARTFRGQAPPGYGVQLRIDGSIVAQQIVGLSGEYEFSDVLLAPRQLNQIEIYVFDYHNFRVPVDIQEIRLTTSDLLLPDGKIVLLGGAGVDGNWSDELFQPDIEQTHKFAGFSQWRMGVSENFTVEASVQHVSDTLQVQGGFISQLANPFVLAAGVGVSNEKVGYTVDLDGIFPRWRLFAKSFRIPEGFHPGDESEENWNHSAELTYNVNKKLDIGLIASSHKSSAHHSDYVLPFGAWRPVSRLSLRARPDSEGDYRFYGNYSITSAVQLSATFQDPTCNINLSYRFKKQYALSFSSAFADNEDDTRYSAILSRSGDWKTGTNFRVGLLADNETVGWLVAAGRYILPGIRAEISYQSLPPAVEDGEEQNYLLTFGITLDFAYAQGRFLPTYGTVASKNRGAIAGRIVIEDAQNLSRYDLSNIAIVIHGKRSTRTDATGNFYISNLKKGIYIVELDIENLSIELVPERTSIVAGVAPGATTRVDFIIRPEFGIAGRVTESNGRHLDGIVVELFDSEGNFLKSAFTDQFGLYRIDGMPPGNYIVRISSESFPDQSMKLPERQVVINNDFLFDQNLQISGP